MAVTIAALSHLLGDAVEHLTEAQVYVEQGEMNAAVGTLLDLETRLTDAAALHRSILVLHRQR
jgi:hypothetical protein